MPEGPAAWELRVSGGDHHAYSLWATNRHSSRSVSATWENTAKVGKSELEKRPVTAWWLRWLISMRQKKWPYMAVNLLNKLLLIVHVMDWILQHFSDKALDGGGGTLVTVNKGVRSVRHIPAHDTRSSARSLCGKF